MTSQGVESVLYWLWVGVGTGWQLILVRRSNYGGRVLTAAGVDDFRFFDSLWVLAEDLSLLFFWFEAVVIVAVLVVVVEAIVVEEAVVFPMRLVPLLPCLMMTMMPVSEVAVIMNVVFPFLPIAMWVGCLALAAKTQTHVGASAILFHIVACAIVNADHLDV